MEFVGHKRIKMFQIDGEIDDDNNIPRVRQRYEKSLVDIMRSQGFVPHLDLEPAFSLEYDNKRYKFLMSIYGVYVGKAKAKCFHGVTVNNLIPMTSTQTSK
jgi:hypothetical protein